LWISGESPELAHSGELLATPEKLMIGTSIVNIWRGEPTTTAEAYLQKAKRFQAGSCWASVSVTASRTGLTPNPWRH
jgi:hypothetical protein